MQIKIIVLLTILFMFSCDKFQDAVGEHSEIIIITSNEDREYIALYLDDIVNKYINTPIEEKIYNVKFINPENFSNYKYYKNIIIASIKHPVDNTIDLLFNKFSESYNESNVFSLKDLYAHGQIIVLIGAHDSVQFGEYYTGNKEWIQNELERNINSNIYNSYINKEINQEIIQTINDNFGLDLFIDEDYKIIRDKKDFLWIGRGFPYRWLMVHKKDVKVENDYWKIYSNLLYEHTDGINISQYYNKIYVKDDFVLLSGIYEHETSDTGGPFFVYIFENNTNNEVILVSGFVNNPGKDKYPLLKEMKVLVENIKRN